MKINKSRVMKRAWSTYYSDKNFEDEKTFAECLKESWAQEKEFVAEMNAKYSDDDESVKAWNWAERKLGVHFENMSNYEKASNVDNMQKEMWTSNVWAQAIKAVKLEIELFGAA